MSSPRVNTQAEEPFECSSLLRVINACVTFYNSTLRNDLDNGQTSTRRRHLAAWIRKFHRDCGTLTQGVEEAIERLS